MKNIKILTGVLLLVAFAGCEDFLKTEDLYSSNEENFYSNPEEIQQALSGAYACLPLDEMWKGYTYVSELMSDDRFGAGGYADIDQHAVDQFENYDISDHYLSNWSQNYRGILRVNKIISRFDQAEYDDDAMKDRDLGEAYFLRGYFYLRLTQVFGEVPLKLDPVAGILPKSPADVLFGQIASDFKKAIELLSAERIVPAGPRDGHATKWAAQGMMAKAFLFYTGYYSKPDMPLAEGGAITKDQATAWLDDCIANSGHDLLSDFRNLWPYSYVPDSIYKYVADNNLQWAGDGNIEILFAIKFSSYGGWDPPDNGSRASYCNKMPLFFGPRVSKNEYFPFGIGWGIGTVNPQLWDSFEPGDHRQHGSILNVVDDVPGEEQIKANYIWGGTMPDAQYQETGHWNKKYIPVSVYSSEKPGKIVGMFYDIYGSYADYQLWDMRDEVLLRFADVLLMAAELGSASAQNYFDRVRIRAGLTSKPVSLEAIKLERRHELAFEGSRYFDLLRWHDAETAFAVANNIPVKTGGLDDIYTVNFRPERAFLKIPESEVSLSGGVLKQNPGWE